MGGAWGVIAFTVSNVEKRLTFAVNLGLPKRRMRDADSLVSEIRHGLRLEIS